MKLSQTIYLTDHNESLHMSRQLHCRDMCKISLWLVEYILKQSTANSGWISNLIEISLVGQVHGHLADVTKRNFSRRMVNYKNEPWGTSAIFAKISDVSENNSADMYYSDVAWALWCLKSLTTQLFVHHFVQAHITENIKALHHWPFVRGIHQWMTQQLCSYALCKIL